VGSAVTNPSTISPLGATMSTVSPSCGGAQSASGVLMVAAYFLNRWITTGAARQRRPSLNLLGSSTQSGSNPGGDDASPVGHGAELSQGNGSWSAYPLSKLHVRFSRWPLASASFCPNVFHHTFARIGSPPPGGTGGETTFVGTFGDPGHARAAGVSLYREF